MRTSGRAPRRTNMLQVALLGGLAVTCVYPLVFVISTALRTQREYADNPLGLPARPSLTALEEAWTRADVGTFAVNSLVVVSIAVVLIVAAASVAGYALVHLRFPLRKAGFGLVLLLMMLPATVLMIPIFRTVQDLGLLNSYLGLVLVYVSLNAPFSIYMMSSFYRRLPTELLEAAYVDGASTLRTFWSVVLPLAKPALLTLVTLNFLWLWNELLFSLLIVQDPSRRTLMVGLALLKGEYTTDIPLLASGLVLALVPPLVIFLLFQRSLVSGLTAGAVK